MKPPLRVTPQTQIVEGTGKFTRDGFNLLSEILYRLQTLQTLPSYAAADIAAVGSAVNTSGKAAGLQVWDTTNSRVMVASGALPASPWYIADGSASVTPA